jgi:hypothetical protein
MGHRKLSSLSTGSQKVLQEKFWDTENAVDWEGATHGPGASSGSSGCVDALQRLEAERTALLRSKQAELDAIEDRHDDLVRR